MLNRTVFVALALVLGFSGCGKKEETPSPGQAAKATSGELPSLASPAVAPPPVVAAPTPPVPPPPGAVSATAAVAAPAAGQFNGLVYSVDPDGNAMTSEKMIYRALEIYIEGQGKPWPKDLNELIQAKVLQAIPPAPPGKRWALDDKQRKVVLAGQ